MKTGAASRYIVPMRLAILLVACSSAPPPVIANTPTGGTTDRVALAVVFSGWEIFAGNTQLTADDQPDYFEGVLPAIATEAPKLAGIGADGSVAPLIVYEDRSYIARPLTKLGDISGDWFGTQKDYYRKTGVELVAGVKLAVSTLAAAPRDLRRVILVIGDGCDTNNETAKPQIAKLELAKQNIALHEIRIATKLSPENCDVLGGVAKLEGKTLIAGFDAFVASFR